MKFFYLIPSKKFDDIKPYLTQHQNEDLLYSNKLPPNKTLNLYDDIVRRNNLATTDGEENLKKEDKPNDKKNMGETSVDHDQHSIENTSQTRADRSMIIPLYVNTLTKRHRDAGKELINDLLSRDIISIEDDGTIQSKYSNHEISMESFLRSLFSKNASLRESKEFLMDVKQYLPLNIIENSKVLNLSQGNSSTVQSGGSLIPQKFWCIYRN